MISETSEKHSEKTISGKRISRPILKTTAELTAATLNRYLVKRTKALAWNFTIVSGQDNAENLKALKSALRSSKNVQKLAFKYDINENEAFVGDEEAQTTSVLRSFGQSLRGMSSLKRISFVFARLSTGEEFNKAGMSYLRRGLKSLTSLKSMKLDCGNNPNIAHLKALKFLQNVSLDFNQSKITDKGIENLAQALKRLTHLHNLNLKFSRCRGVTGKGLQNFGQGLGSLTQLQKIHLDFSQRCGLTDEGMSCIGQGMKALPSLSHLKLTFSQLLYVTDGGMFNLGEGLKEIIHLKNLDLSFGFSPNIRDKGLSNLGLGLAKLHSLQSLKIWIFRCENISDIGLFDSSLNGLVSLQNISIRLNFCPNITDEGVYRFGLGLATLVSLKNFTLILSKCEKLTGAGMQGFGKAFQFLSSLQNLEIWLSGCSEFTEAGMHGLSEGLKALVSLKNLRLALSGFAIPERGMRHLNQSWTYLPLENIGLEFSQNALDDTMVEDLGKSLNQIGSLKHVVVNLGQDQNVTKTGKDSFFQALNGHQCLEDIKFHP